MGWIVASRVRDTSTTAGTGNVTVTGTAPLTYRTFSAVLATGDNFPYWIASRSADEWEAGIGTWQGSNAFSRDLVLSSSNAGALVNFTAAQTKDVVLDPEAFFYNTPKASMEGGFLAWQMLGGL